MSSDPSGRDVGCGIVALLAAVMLVVSTIGGVFSLAFDGMAFGWIVGLIFNTLFWYWIAVGAWRRTIWAATPRSDDPAP